MSSKLIGLIYVALCFVLVGSSYPIAQQAMEEVPTWTFTSITFAIGFLFLLPITIKSEKTNWFKISMKDWGIVAILSLLGAVLYTVFLLYGLPSTSATTASVITSAAPAFVVVISTLFFREKLTFSVALSVILAIVSVVVISLPSGENSGSTTALGLIFLLLSTLSNALNIVLAGKLQCSLKPMSMAAGVCLTGLVFSIPMTISELQTYSISSLTGNNIAIMIYYGVFVWAVPYMFFFKGVTKISSASAGICVSVVPVASMITAALFYDQSVTSVGLFATAIIILSIILSEVDITKFFKKRQPSTSSL